MNEIGNGATFEVFIVVIRFSLLFHRGNVENFKVMPPIKKKASLHREKMTEMSFPMFSMLELE